MIPSRASRQYRCQHKHAVPSLLWHAEFRFRSFIYFNSPLLQQAYKTARPEVRPSPPLRCRRRAASHGHVPGGQRDRPRRLLAAALPGQTTATSRVQRACPRRTPRRLRLQWPASSWQWRQRHRRTPASQAPAAAVSLGSAPDLAARAGSCRLEVVSCCCSSARCSLPSPPEGPAAATFAWALQELKILQRGSCRKHIK